MALAEHPFICDVCGKDRRRDTNHWFILWTGKVDFGEDSPSSLVIEKWDLARAVLEKRKHVCGVSCASRLTERFLTLGTLDEIKLSAGIVKH